MKKKVLSRRMRKRKVLDFPPLFMRGAPLPTGKADIRLLMKQLPESNTEPKWRGRAETWLTHTLFLFFTGSLWNVVCWWVCCWLSGKPSFFPSRTELSILSLRLFPNVPVLSLYLFCHRKQQLLSDASTYSLSSPFELPRSLCVSSLFIDFYCKDRSCSWI